MPNLKVRLLLRVKTADGKRPFLNPAYAANRKIRPLWAIYLGQPTHFPSANYYLRFKQGSKLVFENVGSQLDVAFQQLRHRTKVLESKALGIRLKECEIARCGRSLDQAIQTYLDGKAALSSVKTSNGYGYVLRQFQAACNKQYLEELTRADMIAFIADQKRTGMGDRTVFNRVGYIDTFLRSVKVPKLLPNAEWPKYVEKKVQAYTEPSVTRLLAHADFEERVIFSFFLATGCREQEAAHACWGDVGFEDGTFKVCAKPDLHWRPKDYEERVIPMPDELLAMLREHRKSDPKGRLIFPNGHGGVEGHFLRRLQTLAYEAGLNCGNCVGKTGKSCRNHPMCKVWGLHKFRKSFATWHHESGACLCEPFNIGLVTAILKPQWPICRFLTAAAQRRVISPTRHFVESYGLALS